MDKSISPANQSPNQRLKILAWLIGTIALVTSLISIFIFFLNSQVYRSVGFVASNVFTLVGVGYAIVGLLILTNKPRHRIGWLFLGVSTVFAISGFATQYAVHGLLINSLPGAGLMAWVQKWVDSLIFPAPFVVLTLIFPDGRIPSPRFRLVMWLAVLSTLSLAVGSILDPGEILVYVGTRAITLGIMNQTGQVGWGKVIHILNGAWFLSVLLIFPTFYAPVWRYRRAGAVEKQQIKWLAFPALLFLIVIMPISLMIGGNAGDVTLALMIFLPALATGVAILKYQLYDIDYIIKRTLVYGLLTAVLAGIYFSSVVLLQNLVGRIANQNSPFIIVLSTLLIAALFSPLRRRIQDFIDRRFYRRKYDAAQILAQFAATARDEVDVERLSAVLLGVVEETIQPEETSLWLKKPGDKRVT